MFTPLVYVPRHDTASGAFRVPNEDLVKALKNADPRYEVSVCAGGVCSCQGDRLKELAIHALQRLNEVLVGHTERTTRRVVPGHVHEQREHVLLSVIGHLLRDGSLHVPSGKEEDLQWGTPSRRSPAL